MAGSNGALVNEPYGIMGAGMGLRYSYRKDVQIRFDAPACLRPARRSGSPTDLGASATGVSHVNVTLGF